MVQDPDLDTVFISRKIYVDQFYSIFFYRKWVIQILKRKVAIGNTRNIWKTQTLSSIR